MRASARRSHHSIVLILFSRSLSNSPPNVQVGIPALCQQLPSRDEAANARPAGPACPRAPRRVTAPLAQMPRCAGGAVGPLLRMLTEGQPAASLLPASLLGCPHQTMGEISGAPTPLRQTFSPSQPRGIPEPWGCPVPALAALPVRPKPHHRLCKLQDLHSPSSFVLHRFQLYPEQRARCSRQSPGRANKGQQLFCHTEASFTGGITTSPCSNAGRHCRARPLWRLRHGRLRQEGGELRDYTLGYARTVWQSWEGNGGLGAAPNGAKTPFLGWSRMSS